MSAPYLEEMAALLGAGVKDMHEVADALDISFESACLTFNNGLLKGYWSIKVYGVQEDAPITRPRENAL